MLMQVEVEVPLAAQSLWQASRGDPAVPQSEQISADTPQMLAHVEVEVWFAMQVSKQPTFAQAVSVPQMLAQVDEDV